MPIKSVKMKISKNKKMRFFLMSQGSLNLKIRFLGQKLCSVASERTDRQTDMKVTTVGTFQGFRSFILLPIIKDRPNYKKNVKPKVTFWFIVIILYITHFNIQWFHGVPFHLQDTHLSYMRRKKLRYVVFFTIIY